MDRLETRELAYFLAVADELHFGRAASKLGIAQPALSKAIRRLERRLDTSLFVRTSRTVTLTAAGQVLARDAGTALDAVSAAAARTQRAGARDPRLVLAIKPGGDAGLLPAVLAAYESETDILPVEVVFEGDRTGALRQGHADAALLYIPADDLSGLDTETLLNEEPVAVLPVSHPLAHRPSLRMTDLERERLHKHDPTDTGAVGSLSELMHLIALGRKIAVLPRSLTTPLREDLITIPMTDVPPSVLVLAWLAHTTSPSVAALARAAANVAAAPATRSPTRSATGPSTSAPSSTSPSPSRRA